MYFLSANQLIGCGRVDVLVVKCTHTSHTHTHARTHTHTRTQTGCFQEDGECGLLWQELCLQGKLFPPPTAPTLPTLVGIQAD